MMSVSLLRQLRVRASLPRALESTARGGIWSRVPVRDGFLFGFALAVGALVTSCESGGVGDPCIPEDEYYDTFSGFALGEVSIESRSVQCETRVCLVNKFQGRVTCPYGTNGPPSVNAGAERTVPHNEPCLVPGLGGEVQVPVDAQRVERRPEVAVYCSCRCSGDDPNARYCECPNGFECLNVVTDQGQGRVQLAGGYCVRNNSNVDNVGRVSLEECDLSTQSCADSQ
jgi:hypothetical protein